MELLVYVFYIIIHMIPQGYKHTDLGIIPQEWEVLPLSVAYHLRGGFAFKSDLFSENTGIPIVRISNLPMNGQYVDLSDCVYYPINIEIPSQFTLHTGDLLIAMSGATTGKTAIYNETYDAYLNQRVGVFRQTSDRITYPYLQIIINSKLFSDKLQPLLIAGAQPNISPKDIEQMRFAIPPLKEQQKIAKILGMWDKAIELQSKIIDKLELRKRALMQRLLSGHQRLPGFSTPWGKVRLRDICERVTRKNIENNQNIMTISAQRGFVVQTDFFNKSVASETIENYYLILRDEFCYNKSYSNGHPMGAIKRLSEANKAVVTPLYICFKLKSKTSHNIDYLSFYFDNGRLNHGLTKIANEGGRAHGLLNVTSTDFLGLTLEIPSSKEQTAIAEVLTTANQEIELGKRKLEFLRAQKRGLMQQLLTGKKHVKYKSL